jgi:hypothetical protein
MDDEFKNQENPRERAGLSRGWYDIKLACPTRWVGKTVVLPTCFCKHTVELRVVEPVRSRRRFSFFYPLEVINLSGLRLRLLLLLSHKNLLTETFDGETLPPSSAHNTASTV